MVKGATGRKGAGYAEGKSSDAGAPAGKGGKDYGGKAWGKDDGKGKDGKDKKGGKSGGKGAIPWSFVPLCDDSDPLGLMTISEKVPQAWIDEKHGGRTRKERLHITFALKMTKVEHLDRLENVCGEAGPVELKVKELFLSHVERIRDAEVYCIGVGFESPGLRALKDAWLAGEAADAAKRIHDPYPDKHGHVSLAYIEASAWEEAMDFIDAHKSSIEGKSFMVEAIVYEDERRERMTLRLAGDGGSAPASGGKGSRPGATPAAGHKSQQSALEVDGSVLEGGGQILRNSLGYSAILGYPVSISKIRAGRKTPGLAAQHLESFKLVSDVSSAKLVGDKVGSCDITFTPKKLSAGTFSADPKTAGAITLMVQASLLPVAFAGGTSELELRGGTDVDFSPPLDFVQRVLAPTLAKMGVSFTVDCQHKGFFPAGGGLVSVFVDGLSGALKPIVIDKRGAVTKVEAICYATPPGGWLDEEDVARTEDDFEPWLLEELADKGSAKPKVSLRCEVQPIPDGQKVFKAGCEILVQTSGGGFFHASGGALDGPKGRGSLYDVWGTAAEKAIAKLKPQLKTGAALDEHLLDQLILPASLAQGTSRLLGSKELTLHAQTALHIAEKMVPGVNIKVSKDAQGLTLVECTGIARKPGAAPVAPPSGAGESTTLVAKLSPGTLSKAAKNVVDDLRNDLREFSAYYGLRAEAEVEADLVRIQGCEGPDQMTELRSELGNMFQHYKFSGLQWG